MFHVKHYNKYQSKSYCLLYYLAPIVALFELIFLLLKRKIARAESGISSL